MGRRERTDEEIISSVVIRDILSMPMPVSKNPKIALMFLTPGSLPFEKLWEKFLQVGQNVLVVFVPHKMYLLFVPLKEYKPFKGLSVSLNCKKS